MFTAQQIDPVSGALTGSEVAHFRLKQLQVIFFSSKQPAIVFQNDLVTMYHEPAILLGLRFNSIALECKLYLAFS